ncbi:MAG: Fe-S cluster assembly protein IscX [Chloroflexota bacterium]
MGENSQLTPLYWEATYEIVLDLMEVYPEVDLDAVGLNQLYQWVIALPNFADDPALANNAILTDILREWYEETNRI